MNTETSLALNLIQILSVCYLWSTDLKMARNTPRCMWLSSWSESEGASDNLSILSVRAGGPCYGQSSLLSTVCQKLPIQGEERKRNTSNNAHNCLLQGLPGAMLCRQWLTHNIWTDHYEKQGVWMVGIPARYCRNIKEEFQLGVRVA